MKAAALAFKEWEPNPDAYKKSRFALRRTIKQAKRQYRIKSESDVSKHINRSTFTKPLGQMDNQDVTSKHARTNCQVSSHFQPLPDWVCNTYMFQADHHSPCAQGSEGNLPKWLLPHSTHVGSHEVL